MKTKMLELPGLRMNVLDQGYGDAVLLLHGFPDSHRLWRNQVPALLDAGYRVIAPDLRGFGESDRPADVGLYETQHMVGDVLGLMAALELERVKLVAHDWGAFLGWMLCLAAPQKVERYIALSVGHPASFLGAGLEQRRLSWYMLLFQLPGVEAYIMANDWAFFREFQQHHCELGNWLADLSRPGALTAGLNWYRANANPLLVADPSSIPRSRVPTTGIWSSGDAYLSEAQMLNSASFMDAPWRYERIEGASHWMQLDRPELLSLCLRRLLREDWIST